MPKRKYTRRPKSAWPFVVLPAELTFAQLIQPNHYVCLRFVFVGKTRKRIKILWWDRSGLALVYKRLEKGTFPIPAASAKGGSHLMPTPKNLLILLDGVALESVRSHASVHIPR